MNSEIFDILNKSNPVKALLGSNPLRVYPWGRAPENPRLPYVVYTMYSASPENYLGTRGDIDRKSVQVNIYADTAARNTSCFNAIRNSLEGKAYLTTYRANEVDEDKDTYSTIMEFDFWESR